MERNTRMDRAGTELGDMGELHDEMPRGQMEAEGSGGEMPQGQMERHSSL